MSEVQIWHNPRCSKSRQAMDILTEAGVEAEVVKYLEADLDEEQIKTLLLMLDIEARDLMRTKEDIYKEMNLANVADQGTLIRAMVRFPKLIERPIVIKDGKAIIGRPPEKIIELLN